MEAFTYKCLDCGAALKFDTDSGQLYCDHCVQYFPRELFKEQEEQAEKERIETKQYIGGAKMSVRIYRCSSCGAEVMTGDAEVSRMCSFCGNPTILFDRISQEHRPEKIIPFQMTAEEALRRVKELFSKALYLECDPNEIKTESIYPIYMPYWVYTSFSSVAATISVRDDKTTKTYYDVVSGDSTVPMDASGRFQDDISILLNPYRVEEAEEFDMPYLSGFYADRSDVGSKEREMDVRIYLRNRNLEQILNRTPGVPGAKLRNAMDSKFRHLFGKYSYSVTHEEYMTKKKEYMLLPVYFLTFRVGSNPIIILVNGQTGKIVGNIPVNAAKVQTRQWIDTILGGILGGIASWLAVRLFGPEYVLAAIPVGCLAVYFLGKSAKKEFITRYYRTNSARMFELSDSRK